MHEAALAAEQAEHGDLLQVAVPESYETLFPKLVASWRWAICTHKFQYFMHADDDSFVRLEKLLAWLTSYEARGSPFRPSAPPSHRARSRLCLPLPCACAVI